MGLGNWYIILEILSNGLILEFELFTSKGLSISYDTCVLATGSHAALPLYAYVPQARAKSTHGFFVYRTLGDLDRMMPFTSTQDNKVDRVTVIGGGLFGLEAAKALLDLANVGQVAIIERSEWVYIMS